MLFIDSRYRAKMSKASNLGCFVLLKLLLIICFQAILNRANANVHGLIRYEVFVIAGYIVKSMSVAARSTQPDAC